jgi:hypothetical protein
MATHKEMSRYVWSASTNCLPVETVIKVTGHPFWRFAENRYCALNISPILITFSPNIRQCRQNMIMF